MTREEAILNLKILKEDYWDDDGYGHETEAYKDTMLALDMAVNALEQEPKTETVTEFADRCKECGAKYGRLLKQEPKQGHWIERIERDEYNDYEEEWFECDQCHIDAERPCNYCPNCGCRMESEDN